MLISNVHKSIDVMNSIGTRLSRNVLKPFNKLAVRALSSLKHSAAPRVLNVIKPTPVRLLNITQCRLYMP